VENNLLNTSSSIFLRFPRFGFHALEIFPRLVLSPLIFSRQWRSLFENFSVSMPLQQQHIATCINLRSPKRENIKHMHSFSCSSNCSGIVFSVLWWRSFWLMQLWSCCSFKISISVVCVAVSSGYQNELKALRWDKSELWEKDKCWSHFTFRLE
jgi:hypothetical protein